MRGSTAALAGVVFISLCYHGKQNLKMLQAWATRNAPLASFCRSLRQYSRPPANLAGLTEVQGVMVMVTCRERNARGAVGVAGRYDGAGMMSVDLSMPILVVDDYSTMVRIIRNLLRQVGFTHVDDASDGIGALRRLRDKQYRLVISDWNMEPMSGYELLKEMRSDPVLASVAFIMITAESKTENVIAAKKAGVSNYIVKPFNAATLKAKIDAVFVNEPSCVA
jgi:two-component system chemotaxis response regulator CheY